MCTADGPILPCFRCTGESQFITAPVPARLNFNLESDFRDDDDDVKGIADSDTRLVSMLAAQAAFNDGSGLEDEDEVAGNAKLSDRAKTEHLQRALNMAASNGDEAKVKRILEGKGKRYVDVNAPDEEGTSPLIYASCFVSLCFSVLAGELGCADLRKGLGGGEKRRRRRRRRRKRRMWAEFCACCGLGLR